MSEAREWSRRCALGVLIETRAHTLRLELWQVAEQYDIDETTLNHLVSGRVRRVTDPLAIEKIAQFLEIEEMNVRLAMDDQPPLELSIEDRLTGPEIGDKLRAELDQQVQNLTTLSPTIKRAGAMAIEIGQCVYDIGLRLCGQHGVPAADFGERYPVYVAGRVQTVELPDSRTFSTEDKQSYLRQLNRCSLLLQEHRDDFTWYRLVGVAVQCIGRHMMCNPDEEIQAIIERMLG